MAETKFILLFIIHKTCFVFAFARSSQPRVFLYNFNNRNQPIGKKIISLQNYQMSHDKENISLSNLFWF